MALEKKMLPPKMFTPVPKTFIKDNHSKIWELLLGIWPSYGSRCMNQVRNAQSAQIRNRPY